MIIKVAYCGYVRKDGSINAVTFNIDKKTYTTEDTSIWDTFVEARISKDVTNLKKILDKAGYIRV